MPTNVSNDELKYYARIGGEAFMEDPMYTWVCPKEKTRRGYTTEMLLLRLYASAKTDFFYFDEEKRGLLVMRHAHHDYGFKEMIQCPNRFKMNFYLPFTIKHLSFYSAFDNKKYFDDKTYIISPVFTAKEHQGKGVASALVKKAVADMYSKGYKVGLDTQNPDNISFYEKLGFKLVGEQYNEKANLSNYYMLYEA